MAAEATLGSYRKHSFMIYIFVCIAGGAWLTYDGYFSESFKEKHNPNGIPDSTYTANRYAPYVLGPLAILFAGRWFMVRNAKVVADGKDLILECGKKIPYGKIEKIDKTQFEKKGAFTVFYTDESGAQASVKLNDRDYDKIDGVLDELVAALKGEQA